MKYEVDWKPTSYSTVVDTGLIPEEGDILILTKSKGKVRTAFVVVSDELSDRCANCDLSYRSCVHYWFACRAGIALKKLDNIMEDL